MLFQHALLKNLKKQTNYLTFLKLSEYINYLDWFLGRAETRKMSTVTTVCSELAYILDFQHKNIILGKQIKSNFLPHLDQNECKKNLKPDHVLENCSFCVKLSNIDI